MIRLFKHYIPTPLLFLGVIEFLLLLISAEAAWQLRADQIGIDALPTTDRFGEVLTYAMVVSVVMLATGLYQPLHGYRSVRLVATRLLVAFALSLVVLAVVFFLLPNVALWRSIFLYAALFSYVLIMVARGVFGKLINWNRFRRRVVVLGAGERAAKLEEVSRSPDAGFQIVRYVRMTDREPRVAGAVVREEVSSFYDLADELGVEEIVLALEERRGALPTGDLLKAKLAGVHVTDMSSFLERETGRVDLGSVSPSWLIFSDGFLGAKGSAVLGKRLYDIAASSLLLAISSPLLLVAAALIKLTSPGPVFYRQERVGQFGRSFDVIKFRSMRTDAEKDGTPQWAQKSDPRVTAIGRIIRATRIDEIPQIINVLRGDMSFVGPRPERPFFVQDLAAQIPFYNERHVVKPGITGWAQLNYPYGASVDDARHKLEYDLYYVKNYSMFLDLLILIQTVRVILWRDGVR
ncbi:TIGR03013 family XrtA/PEP-CTERM system glycosyltransferase [Sphingoaurantiacus capsulatus]|uniref:TIGR03013 family XrtA/PEP-CTERM system glycosyltransferase n=1 Tax=Sphingoaurantiacus capsulatus TaxID=1771310 RepID=A0ABV7XEV8_9SPHN